MTGSHTTQEITTLQRSGLRVPACRWKLCDKTWLNEAIETIKLREANLLPAGKSDDEINAMLRNRFYEKYRDMCQKATMGQTRTQARSGAAAVSQAANHAAGVLGRDARCLRYS
jgi:hypothetical protein